MLLDEDHPYDCNTHECLTNTDEVEVKALGIAMTITRDNYEEFFEEVKRENIKSGGRTDLPDWIIIEQADMCPHFMFTDTLYNTLRYFNLCDGLTANDPEELDNKLGLWVDACSVISGQQQKWLPIKAKQMQEQKKDGK